jgi:hypothetical protein
MQWAATYFGTPAGAAAFAAWYTYKSTNNIGLAIRAGIIEGIKATALKGLDKKVPVDNVDALGAKAIVTGAIGGGATAAAGGSAADIRHTFLSSGGTVVVLDGYELKTGRSLGKDAKAATSAIGGFFMNSEPTDKSSNIPPSKGTQSKLTPPPKGGLQIGKEEWRINWYMEHFGTPLPAIVLTYVGERPLYVRPTLKELLNWGGDYFPIPKP